MGNPQRRGRVAKCSLSNNGVPPLGWLFRDTPRESTSRAWLSDWFPNADRSGFRSSDSLPKLTATDEHRSDRAGFAAFDKRSGGLFPLARKATAAGPRNHESIYSLQARLDR